MNLERKSRAVLFLVVGALAAGTSSMEARDGRGEVARASISSSRIDWVPMGSYQCLQLTVSGPDLTFQKAFAAGEDPSFELPAGAQNGFYGWELSRSDEPCGAQLPDTTPVEDTSFDLEGGKKVQAPVQRVALDANGRPASRQGKPERTPSGAYLQSGRFRVQGGAIVPPNEAREPRRRRP